MNNTLTTLRRIRGSVAVAYDLSADDSHVAARLKLGEVEDELEALIASMEAQPEPQVTYAHRNDADGVNAVRFMQFAKDPLPAWAADVRPAQPKAEPSPVTLKVVNGDICIKSLDMDQSYGMWIPVTYSTEHGFVEGTCFYTK